jgi:hypothetical protein
MADGFAAGALLGHVYRLEDGTGVRLRMARGSDLQAIGELLDQDGSGLSAIRFVHFDPRREYVLCATALIDGQELLLGLGVTPLDGGVAGPEVHVADGGAGDDVRGLLTTVLTDTARAISRSRAASGSRNGDVRAVRRGSVGAIAAELCLNLPPARSEQARGRIDASDRPEGRLTAPTPAHGRRTAPSPAPSRVWWPPGGG